MTDEEWAVRLAALYGEPLASFTPARDALAKELKAAGDTEAAARAKALRKPVLAAWVLNLLVRRDAEQVDQVLTLGESLRAAAADLDGDELRTLTRQRRRLTAAVTTQARELAREAGVKVTAAVADQVEGTLHAAMLSDAASVAVRTGALVRAVAPAEVGELADAADLADAVADPALLGTRAPAVEAPDSRPDLRVVVDDGAVRREAEEAVEEAREALTEAEAEAAEADDAVATLRARTLQVEEEIDELKRRIATLDATLEEVTDELEEAEEGAEDASLVREEATAALREAEQALARLGS